MTAPIRQVIDRCSRTVMLSSDGLILWSVPSMWGCICLGTVYPACYMICSPSRQTGHILPWSSAFCNFQTRTKFRTDRFILQFSSG